jgi:adenosine deaminase
VKQIFDVSSIPKAELHAHIEGTATPDLVRRLARRNNMELPTNMFTDEGHYSWSGFPEFLLAYDRTAACIQTKEDYYDVAREYLTSCAEDGAVYVEFFTSPDNPAVHGIGFEEHLENIALAIEDVQKETGLVARMIVSCVRHLGPEKALAVAKSIADNPHAHVVGFGMGGDELKYSVEDFRPAYEIAAEAGLGCTVHAGEADGPNSVREAISLLPVTRIGHGVRAIEDPDVVSEIVNRNIVLEICPNSNLYTGVYESFSKHPLPDLKEAGCRITLNSDDPPFFFSGIGKEYADAALHFGLDEATLTDITRTAIEASFVDDETKTDLLSGIDSKRHLTD